jgi:ClpP class serine protease
VEPTRSSFLAHLAGLTKIVFWLVLLLIVVQQAYSPRRVAAARADLIQRFQEERSSRVIAMIHRQETVTFLGIPLASEIDIEDPEAVLRAIRLTPPEQPIDLILHTPGGLVLAAEQIAHALVEHKGKVSVFMPHYAMSGGTLLALTADEVVMDPNAVLGPVDPEVGGMPAASIVKALELKGPAQVSDQFLVLADVAQKARLQMASFLAEVLLRHLPKEKAADLAVAMSEGRWTHDFPITVEAARSLGIPVSTEMPTLNYELMDLYPQGGIQRPSVAYVPLRGPRPGAPGQVPAT